MLELQLDDTAKNILLNFALVRDAFATELSILIDPSLTLREFSRLKIVVSHAEDILIAEVNYYICTNIPSQCLWIIRLMK